MAYNDDYTCALSGIAAKDEERPKHSTQIDELEDLPVGWSKVTIQTRVKNPHWINIQQIKVTVLEQLIQQVDDEQKEEARKIMKYQVDAQFAALESMTSPYFIDERVCYISNPESSKGVKDEWDSLIERLDLAEEGD